MRRLALINYLLTLKVPGGIKAGIKYVIYGSFVSRVMFRGMRSYEEGNDLDFVEGDQPASSIGDSSPPASSSSSSLHVMIN